MDSRQLGDPGTPAFTAEKYPFFQLNRLVGRYNAVIEPRLRMLGLDIPYWRVLMVLGERAPRGVRDIAEAAVIPLSTMTRIVQRMAAAGLVATGPSMADNRVTAVALTPAGRERLAEARRVTAPVYAKAISGFSAEEFESLLALLGRFYTNLDPE